MRPSETPEAGAEVVYFRDVTAVVELNRVKAQFVATAAHELRTPVAVILGYAELLQSSHPQPRDQDMMLSTIQRHGKHVAGLINEMLDLATLDARGGRDLELVDQPLVPVVREGVESFRLPGDPRVASFSTEGEVAGRVRIDRAKFRQALDNVLSNAFKYSTTDTLVRVRVQGRSAEGRAQLGVAIIDQGPGMDVATQAQVFERFFRAEDVSSTVPGTGLGMSIVKEIMELHGGQVEIDSAPGCGTTVTLWLQSVP